MAAQPARRNTSSAGMRQAFPPAPAHAHLCTPPPIFCGEAQREKGRAEEATGTPYWSRVHVLQLQRVAVPQRRRPAGGGGVSGQALACERARGIRGASVLAAQSPHQHRPWHPGSPGGPSPRLAVAVHNLRCFRVRLSDTAGIGVEVESRGINGLGGGGLVGQRAADPALCGMAWQQAGSSGRHQQAIWPWGRGRSRTQGAGKSHAPLAGNTRL